MCSKFEFSLSFGRAMLIHDLYWNVVNMFNLARYTIRKSSKVFSMLNRYFEVGAVGVRLNRNTCVNLNQVKIIFENIIFDACLCNRLGS